MDLYSCIDCGSEPVRMSVSGKIEKLECSNPDCDNFEVRTIKLEDEFEALEYQWNAANFKSKAEPVIIRTRADIIDDNFAKIICYTSGCTIGLGCGRYLPDDEKHRRDFFKPDELVRMRNFKQKPDGSCEHLMVVNVE